MLAITNISILYQCKVEDTQADVHPIKHAALVCEQDKIVWVGKQNELPNNYSNAKTIDAHGGILVPGLIDCHTHLCFSGWREDEFEQRILGKSYLEIAKSGGGIQKTVNETRKASAEKLLEHCNSVLSQMANHGVTTIECKSGYGLDVETELKILRVYKKLKDQTKINLVSTFLGAHPIPAEHKSSRGNYVRILIHELLPKVAAEGLADFCDVFVEETAFSPQEAKEILLAAQKYGLRSKLHVDQFSDSGGALLAAEVNAISADHLEYTSAAGFKALANKNIIAVALPFSALYTNQKHFNARLAIEAGVSVALASDFNPGTAACSNLQTAMFLGSTICRLTPSECLKAVTINAARALGKDSTLGSIEVGKQADFILVDCHSVNEWIYRAGASPVRRALKGIFLD